MRAAEKIVGVSLPSVQDIYSTRLIRKASALQVIPPTRHTASSICCHQGGDCGVSGQDQQTEGQLHPSGSWTPSPPLLSYIYIYILYIWFVLLYFYVLLLVFSVICVHQGVRVTQFQFSVCMYGTCGRIDNKADFDFEISSWDSERERERENKAFISGFELESFVFFTELKHFTLDLTTLFSAHGTEAYQWVNICSSELATTALPFELWAERINCPCGGLQMFCYAIGT